MRAQPLRELTTRWWAGKLGAKGTLLHALAAPAAAAYELAIEARNRRYDRGAGITRVSVPVISVGNIAVGGAGKTPVAAWLLRMLRERGRCPALLHGGYADDEPELHRAWAPGAIVIAERDRVAAARTAMARGADVLVLDDGFQHRRLARDLDLALVSAERWTLTPQLLPRGPWRERPEALGRATLVAVTRRTATRERAATVAEQVLQYTSAPLLQLQLRAAGWEQNGAPAGPPPGWALAVAGIADPEAFAENARRANAQVHALLPFPDHHRYDAADARRILAAAVQGRIVTTAKDWIKLRTLLSAEQVWVLRQEVVIESGGDALAHALERVLA